MFVYDFADAVIFFMNKKIRESFINIGTGKYFSIIWYAKFIMRKLNVKLRIRFDKSKPDGSQKSALISQEQKNMAGDQKIIFIWELKLRMIVF